VPPSHNAQSFFFSKIYKRLAVDFEWWIEADMATEHQAYQLVRLSPLLKPARPLVTRPYGLLQRIHVVVLDLLPIAHLVRHLAASAITDLASPVRLRIDGLHQNRDVVQSMSVRSYDEQLRLLTQARRVRPQARYAEFHRARPAVTLSELFRITLRCSWPFVTWLDRAQPRGQRPMRVIIRCI
jgi:hypothetical protein